MTQYRKFNVIEIIESHKDLIKIRLEDQSRAYCFPLVNGHVSVGDEVIVNTTAIDLNLGTGGWHFVVWNLSNSNIDTPRGGHIMKLRYTPLQIDSGVAEEFDDWDHEKNSLESMPIIAAPIHSQIPAIATHLKHNKPDLKICVVISDGASLPMSMSDVLRQLADSQIVDSTVTYGHAFGGDIEALNIYTALLSAKHRALADVTIVSMGPGIVGTNSKFGFTGIEVAHHLDVASSLGGRTYGVLRASSADPRARHRGISHHAITTYAYSTNRRHTLGLIEDHELSSSMRQQLLDNKIDKMHELIEVNSIGAVDLMEAANLDITSMGRHARQDELFYEMATAASQLVLKDMK